jgi:NAD(P)H-hydrate epimerase
MKKPPSCWLLPRPAAAHKNDFGHVLVIGGSRGMLGAPRLAALGALRGGAGLVTLAVPESVEPLASAGGPWEALTLALPDRRGALTAAAVGPARRYLSERRVSAVALGPGLSLAGGAPAFVRRFLSSIGVPAVLDADGLNALAGNRFAPRAPLILTPHPGEMARLLGVSREAVEKDRPAAARRAARRYGAVVALKGRGTVISDGERAWVNRTGNPGMATGGAGDVLAGLVAALIAQVEAEGLPERLWRATVLGVALHGLAGDLARDRLGEVSLIAGDIAAALPSAFQKFS